MLGLRLSRYCRIRRTATATTTVAHIPGKSVAIVFAACETKEKHVCTM